MRAGCPFSPSSAARSGCMRSNTLPSYTSYTPRHTRSSVDSTSSFGAASAAASSSAAPSASGAAAAAAPRSAVARAITSSTNRGTIPRPSPASPSTVYVLPVPVCPYAKMVTWNPAENLAANGETLRVHLLTNCRFKIKK